MFVLRTNPPRLGTKFVVRMTDDKGHASFGGVLDLRNGQYVVAYRHMAVAGPGHVTVALIEGGEVVARRWFSVATVVGRPVVAKCYGMGQGLFSPQVGRNVFIVQSRSHCNASLSVGGMTFSATLNHAASGSQIPLAVVDNQDGTYTVEYEIGETGKWTLDVVSQSQSISGFPYAIDMDFQAIYTGRNAMRKLDEEIAYLTARLARVQLIASSNSTDMTSASGAKAQQLTSVVRLCTHCTRRPVEAVLLPCRHYRYCVECAASAYVLGSSCSVCDEPSTGYFVVQPTNE